MAKSIFKCKICGEKYTSLEGLYSHLEEEHESMIPPNMSVEQYYYYLKTGKEFGSCVVCKGKTPWNEKTKKYHRFCGDPMCKAKYKETVDQRMIGKYGKVNLLNEPDHQRKMLMGRSISGEYNFDGVMKPYVGSYELDFLKTMDLFFDWDPRDIEMPSPHTYYYMYEGEKHFYIPDAFIMSLGLEIEIKDGGNNPNMHHKIQDVDKEKERLKDEVMHNQKLHHYIKLTNKNYWNLFEFFRISKEHVEKYGDYEKIPRIILDEDIGAKKISSNSRSLMKEEANKAVNENLEFVDERYILDKKNSYINFDLFESGESNICLITGLSGSGKSTLSNEICREHNAYCIELDIFEHPDMELDPDVKRPNDLYINYFKRNPGLKNKLINNDLSNTEIAKEMSLFLDYSIKYCKAHPKDKYVIEGLQIFADIEPENVKGLPIIFVNTSMIHSMIRKYKRDGVKYKVSDLFKWYTEDEKNYNQFKHNIVEENLFLSEDNLEVNIDDFNKHNNILYITGLGGSGKSTIISQYARKYNAEALEFDAVTSALIRGLNHLNRNKIHPIILEYLETENPEPLNGFSDNRFNDECVKFLDWFEEKVANDGNLYVLEGMQIFLCFEPERFKDKPMVIMGTSVAKSMYRSVARTYRRSEGDIAKTFKFFLKTLKRAPIFVKNDRQLDELRDTVSEGFNHILTIGLNKKMNRGLYGFIDNKSYILYDDKVQLKRVNNIMRSLTESFELDDDIEIIKFGFNKDTDININDNNQGAFLRWNRTDDINTLLESISAEWFNSELTIDDFHRIEGDE